MKEENYKELKIMIIGSSGTGKTSFVQRWTNGYFSDEYKPTIVNEFGFKIYESRNILFRVQLWDIGGQDKSASMAKIFARDSHGCLIFTDINSNESDEEIVKWKEIIDEESAFIDDGSIPFILIINKIDLIENDEEKYNLINEKFKNISEKYDFLNYYLTSGKKNINVDESMTFLLENIIDRIQKYCNENNQVIGNQKRKDTVLLKKNNERKYRKEAECCNI